MNKTAKKKGQLTKTAAIEIIRSGKFFSCEFTKQDGQVRKMVARTGVTKHLKGGGAPYKASDMGLITVYEMGTGYRSIPVYNLLKVNGRKVGK
jgi:hypothetical protein